MHRPTAHRPWRPALAGLLAAAALVATAAPVGATTGTAAGGVPDLRQARTVGQLDDAMAAYKGPFQVDLRTESRNPGATGDEAGLVRGTGSIGFDGRTWRFATAGTAYAWVSPREPLATPVRPVLSTGEQLVLWDTAGRRCLSDPLTDGRWTPDGVKKRRTSSASTSTKSSAHQGGNHQKDEKATKRKKKHRATASLWDQVVGVPGAAWHQQDAKVVHQDGSLYFTLTMTSLRAPSTWPTSRAAFVVHLDERGAPRSMEVRSVTPEGGTSVTTEGTFRWSARYPLPRRATSPAVPAAPCRALFTSYEVAATPQTAPWLFTEP